MNTDCLTADEYDSFCKRLIAASSLYGHEHGHQFERVLDELLESAKRNAITFDSEFEQDYVLKAIANYQLDLQFCGDREPLERQWRAYQNIHSTAIAGDLWEGYGDTPENAVWAWVKVVENAKDKIKKSAPA